MKNVALEVNLGCTTNTFKGFCIGLLLIGLDWLKMIPRGELNLIYLYFYF